MYKSQEGLSQKKINKIVIGLASSEVILAASRGEVLKPETINYRTHKPESDGLFCERIFGPVKDYECACGKYKRIRYRGIVCDRCGVEVTEKRVRRNRVGHIQLVSPVAHIWYFRSPPSKMGYLLGMSTKVLSSIIYHEKYVVVNPGLAYQNPEYAEKVVENKVMLTEKEYQQILEELPPGNEELDLEHEDKFIANRRRLDGKYLVVKPGKAVCCKSWPIDGNVVFLSEEEYLNILETLPNKAENQYLDDDHQEKFVAKMGANCLAELLAKIDLKELSQKLRIKARTETSKQRKAEALKRLTVVEAFRKANEEGENRPEWMIMKVIPVIPPELRPLIPLDGGRFATSDLNELYRRVIIRNNRLKRLVEIKAPEVILRNERRMLQEAVDSLFDNTRKSSAVKSDSNRSLKSLSDALKGKQGRFRQNLLGKRVDYSARSVIVSGPELKMYECGLPKAMAAELFKPFIIRKLTERGIVKTIKSAKKIIEKKEPVVYDILENVLKGHPVLLNRAPTLHRLGIQAFQPKLIEGKAIQLHPLVCTAFNADFDGDQMAVHLPLGPEAILEAQLLMLASHNILNPANGYTITVPSQDMVLGLYYMTKIKKSTDEEKVKGEGALFASTSEVKIAYNQNAIDLHATIKIRTNQFNVSTKEPYMETTVGRVLFNELVPENVEYFNILLTKKNLREIIGKILRATDVPTTSEFLDAIKEMGFYYSFKGGLSFNLNDITIPSEKKQIISEAVGELKNVQENYNLGFITSNERYNRILDLWTSASAKLSNIINERTAKDRQGFNSVYMMLDSGARGSMEQLRQVIGMRGLIEKPRRKANVGGVMMETPIKSNFVEGLSILEYFMSTHGARKGLTDTALKTADAGYLTRRLHDVAQDVIVTIDDCGTLIGLEIEALKNNQEIVESLSERILGRVALNDVIDPSTNEVLVQRNEEIDEEKAEIIGNSLVTSVVVRTPLNCMAQKGICAKCYGRNLSTGKMVQQGEAVGVIAAQSIGEPGTQLTLRTFHIGAVKGYVEGENKLEAQFGGIVRISSELRIEKNRQTGNNIVTSTRPADFEILDPNTGNVLTSDKIRYGSYLFVKDGDQIKQGDLICRWDPYNRLIVSDHKGVIQFKNMIKGVSYQIDLDEQTGKEKWNIIPSPSKEVPSMEICRPLVSKGGDDSEVDYEIIKSYVLNVSTQLNIKEGDKVEPGDILAEIPRSSQKSRDLTGGLPRVTELFEARNSSNPAVVAEIDGVVSYGRIRRGNREITVTAKNGTKKTYIVKLYNQIMVQEYDHVEAGTPLSEGPVTLADLLKIRGSLAVQKHLVNEIQEVYRLQGVKINDKHFEVIIRQMMRRVRIKDSGDALFLEDQLVFRNDFIKTNEDLYGKVVVEDQGDSENLKIGQLISKRQLRNENTLLKGKGLALVEARDAKPASGATELQGITKASSESKSFISAASFQTTTKVLNEASIRRKVDRLEGLKENVIIGHRIPAGTGLREYQSILVGNKEEHVSLLTHPEPEDTILEPVE
ncbi:MAG: DNA-directed RNA polymerase subunit beta' [Flavobacteriaceae bacterium]|nr:DNA-directed RNA polymerase subunit beta' [Flavobacteriaceae bacterium]